MHKKPWLLGAVTLDGKGGAKRLTEFDIEKNSSVLKEGTQWINLNLKKYDSINWLQKKAKLEPWVSEILTDTQESRPRTLFHKNALLLVLRTVPVGSRLDPDDMIILRLWVTRSRVITVQTTPVVSLQGIVSDLERRKGPRNGGELLEAILDAVLTDISRTVSNLEYEMDDLEEEIIAHMEDKQTMPELAELQRQLVGIRRYLAPSKEAFDAFSRGRTLWFNEDIIHLAQESQHRMQRILEDVDLLRERARINQEVLQANSAKQNQKNMYMLSVVATLFLPLSFLTGLFGMNVGGIPFATHGFGLAIVTLFIALIGIVLIFIFKKLRWM